MFIKYDIKEFYPSVYKRVHCKPVAIAKDFVNVKSEQVDIIKNCRKSVYSITTKHGVTA